MARVKDQTTVMQEKMDRNLAVINARQIDAQRVWSSTREIHSRVQYELTLVQQTAQNAINDRSKRAEEGTAEEKALAKAREDVTALMAKDREMTGHLLKLRDDFRKLYESNVAMLGHR